MLVLYSCSKGECDCTMTKYEDGIITEETEYKQDAGDDGTCRSRPNSYYENGVYVVESNDCTLAQ